MKTMTKGNALRAAAMLLIASKGIPYLMRNWKRYGMSKGMVQPETRDTKHLKGKRRRDEVTQASMESFPASDAPSFTPGTT